MAGRSAPRQLPASSTSRESPSRCRLRCMAARSVTCGPHSGSPVRSASAVVAVSADADDRRRTSPPRPATPSQISRLGEHVRRFGATAHRFHCPHRPRLLCGSVRDDLEHADEAGPAAIRRSGSTASAALRSAGWRPAATRPRGTAFLRAQTDTSSMYPASGRYQTTTVGTIAQLPACTLQPHAAVPGHEHVGEPRAAGAQRPDRARTGAALPRTRAIRRRARRPGR